jgi:ABC-type Fe3+/spermidine/putrescine transport system ATPase subunit
MDEPLGALDLKMREYMQIELRRIQQELGLTTIYVTHDQVEAMTMSDRIAVMNAGKIEQLDSPEQIYNVPRTRFVANFVGKVNFMTGRVTRHLGSESAIETEDGTLLCRLVQQPVGTSVTMAVRPERLKLFSHHGDVAGMNALHGSVASETFCGNLLHLSVRLRNSSTLLVESKPGEGRWKSGDDVTVAWKAEDAVIMAA